MKFMVSLGLTYRLVCPTYCRSWSRLYKTVLKKLMSVLSVGLLKTPQNGDEMYNFETSYPLNYARNIFYNPPRKLCGLRQVKTGKIAHTYWDIGHGVFKICPPCTTKITSQHSDVLFSQWTQLLVSCESLSVKDVVRRLF